MYDCVRSHRLVLTRGALESLTWRLQLRNLSDHSAHRRLRFLVGSFGGGYTREEIEFVRHTETIPEGGRVVPDVDVDGCKLVVKTSKPYVTPIHWP